ncbi:MAG: T9SS type A sorting domain-containing protein [Flavobacteriales bacterium]|nr:T9SS type A sorting domain-containing protein [Flavobacteriales bacterium]
MRHFILLLCLISNLSAQNLELLQDFTPGTEEGIKFQGSSFSFAKNDSLHAFGFDEQVYSTDGISFDLVHAGVEAEQMESVGNHFVYRHGNRLYSTDGTAQGTQIITSFDNTAYFRGVYYGYLYMMVGTELWKTNGTVLGTQMVKDLGGSYTIPFAYDSSIYLFGNSELLKSDGTAQGTSTILANVNGVSVHHEFNQKCYFGATVGSSNDIELYATDGTSNGTQKVSSLESPLDFFIFQNELFFSAKLFSSADRELQKMDTNEVITNVSTLEFLSLAFIFNNEIYFVANNNAYGREIWKTNGQANQETLLKDIDPSGWGVSITVPAVEYKGKVYFTANDGTSGNEVWVTDGTTNGTSLFKDINTGFSGSNPYYRVLGNDLMIISRIVNDYGLWKSDGTSLNTIKIGDFRSVAYPYFEVFNNRLIFGAAPINDPLNKQYWTSDGTIGGTQMISDVKYGNSTTTMYPYDFYKWNNEIYFTFRNSNSKWMSWKTNGDSLGTTIIDTNNARIFNFNNSNVFYSIQNASNDFDIYKTDGNNNTLIKQGFPTFIFNGVDYGSKAVFFSYDTISTFYEDVWTIDSQGNMENLTAPINNNLSRSIYKANNQLYFSFSDNGNSANWGVHQSDGTASGTSLLKGFSFTGNHDGPYYYFEFNGDVYFDGKTNSSNWDLWKTDGTTLGTVNFKSFAGVGAPSKPVVMGNEFYFTASTNAEGRELWKSDGTTSGTIMVKDVFPGSEDGLDRDLIVFNGKVYFAGRDSEDNIELWSSDGTAAGTQMVKDIFPGSSSMEINQWADDNSNSFFVHQGYLYFTAYDIKNGRELWVTDGTSSGTVLAYDVNPGPLSSNPEITGATNQNLVFIAENMDYGRELWSLKNLVTKTDPLNDRINELTIYPNPCSEHINIEFDQTIDEIRIFNLTGQQIFGERVQSSIYQLDVSHFPSGTYLVQGVDLKGEIYSQKLIKQ